MRTFGTILALLLIFFGLVVAGLIVVRIWQDNGSVQMDINTASVGAGANATGNVAGDVAADVAAGARAANGEPLVAAAPEPLVVGVESGGMALTTPEVASIIAAPPAAPPADQPAPTAESLTTVDPCPPAPAQGFGADTAVVAVGMLRVYSASDVTSPALRDLSAGQGLWIVAGEDGSTAVKRCEVIWQRVRTADGVVGWVLEDAIDVIPSAPITETVAITPTISPCVGGCVQQGCVQPCATPCYQPCPTPCNQPCAVQPCTTPCGVYSK
jgi:hypothetical protein